METLTDVKELSTDAQNSKSFNYQHVKCSKGDQLPANAIKGGYDELPRGKGTTYYHATGTVDGLRMPGWVWAPNNILTDAWLPLGKFADHVDSFEVLTSEWNTSYVECKEGDEPPEHAIEGGYNQGPTYYAKGTVKAKNFEGRMVEIPGKADVQRGNDKILGKAWIPFNYKNEELSKYHVLVLDDKVTNVSFHVDEGKMVSTTPEVLATQENRNETSVQQTMQFSFNETVTETSTFTHQAGVSIEVGTKFECGVPLVADAEFSISVTGSYSFTYGTSNSMAKSFSATFPVNAAPNTIVKCEAIVEKTTLDVPYTITMKSGKTASGIWNGVSAWGLRSSTKETPI